MQTPNALTTFYMYCRNYLAKELCVDANIADSFLPVLGANLADSCWIKLADGAYLLSPSFKLACTLSPLGVTFGRCGMEDAACDM